MRCAVFLLCIGLFLSFVSKAQAIERKIEFQKAQLPAAVIELPYSIDIIDDAIHDYLTKKGYKTGSYKGFSVCRAIPLDSADTELSDVYFKVDHRNKQKDVSVVTLLPTKVNEDLVLATAADNTRMEKAKDLLNRLAPYIEGHNVNVRYKEQDEALRKAQKKMDGLIDDQGDYQKRLRDLQADLEQNKKDQTKQNTVLQNILPSDDDGLKKAQKKRNKLLDEQTDLEKKIRKTQATINENKQDQVNQQQEVDKQKVALESIKKKI